MGFGLLAPRGGLKARLAGVLLLAANVAAFGAHRQLAHMERDWTGFWADREERVATLLSAEMDRLIDRGEAAVSGVIEQDRVVLDPDALADVRRSRGLDALAVYDLGGVPVAWDGVHQGEVPDDAKFGLRPYVYGETPLYSYLYFTRTLPEDQGVVVGAILLRQELPHPLAPDDPDDFVTRFSRRYGEEVRVSRPSRAGVGGVFDYRWQGIDLLSLQVLQPLEAERRETVLLRWVRVVVLLLACAWLLLTWADRDRGRRGMAVGTALLLAALVPLGGLVSAPRLFSPGDFLLPGPVDISAGRLLALAVVGALLSGFVPGPRGRGAPWAGLAMLLLAPATVLGFSASASPGFLGAGETGWVAYELTFSLVLSVLALLALRLGSRQHLAPTRPWLAAVGGGVAVGLAAVVAVAVSAGHGAPLWTATLWAVPTAMIAAALGAETGWPTRAARLTAAAVLGSTLALTFSWSSRVEARRALAEVEIADLGAPVDPYLEFLLERFARELVERESPTLRPIEHLYSAWAGSGLADEGYPAWLTLWEEQNTQREELPIDIVDPRPPSVDSLIPPARLLPLTLHRLDEPGVQYVVTVPLASGWMGSAAIPPRRKLLSSTSLGPLFSQLDGSATQGVTLVPEADNALRDPDGAVAWTRGPDGFVGERSVRFPEGWYRARLIIDLPGPVLLVARGTLLLLAGLVVFLGLGLAGMLVSGLRRSPRGAPRLPGGWASFRVRITLALFGFFLLSTIAIGTVAIRTLSGAAVRTATAIGERVANEAGAELDGGSNGLSELALRVGADLVVYRDGALDRGAVHELVELGLYPGWLPYWIAREFQDGDAVLASEPGRLGTWEYVMAFRRMDGRAAVATPIPVAAGSTALRRREAADLLVFAILMGAGLSFGLALLVGRALARPIQTLQVASERVGAGNLAVRLPGRGSDEFGAVFQAFNRMVQRLSATREELVRATRRTTAIVEDAATGVIATDTDGLVVLVNPRAEAILGQGVRLDRRLDGEGRAREIGRWISTYLSDGAMEATDEFEFGERRVRIRARRTSRSEPHGGAVFSVEDVTDELRAERVLAWGEMARQVAHEVKNPLTPIKLSVQHIQRAWQDGVRDFDTVLNRNAEAVLREIDRLAEIAGSFSRFAAPGSDAEAPLERVDVAGVVDEVLALYRGAGDGPRFGAELDGDLPPVAARVGELKEVLLNLLENARAAIGPEGRVQVSAQTGAGSVLVTVSDNGAGIPGDLLLRIFEPHFSTRSSGTGLGLAIVKRLVESWGGSVTAASQEGVGTELHLVIPEWGRSMDDVTDDGPLES